MSSHRQSFVPVRVRSIELRERESRKRDDSGPGYRGNKNLPANTGEHVPEEENTHLPEKENTHLLRVLFFRYMFALVARAHRPQQASNVYHQMKRRARRRRQNTDCGRKTEEHEETKQDGEPISKNTDLSYLELGRALPGGPTAAASDDDSFAAGPSRPRLLTLALTAEQKPLRASHRGRPIAVVPSSLDRAFALFDEKWAKGE
ncbi:hypothetical protein F5B20DRAFT_583300 [Whalleya microplaca]|nr:hypothetical protein F5B20DRAFT_583300 [Whalleya microplaca]